MPSRLTKWEGYVGTPKRVLFDEVLLLTYDRRRRWGTVIGATGLVLLFAGSAVITALVAEKTPIGVCLTLSAFAMPFLIILVYHLASGSNCITVFGKRTTAQAFVLGSRRAQATFDVLQKRIDGAQEKERRRIAKASPPVASALLD